MQIPFCLGKNSDGIDQFIDLVNVPILMVSFLNEHQLDDVFIQFTFSEQNFVISSSSRLSRWGLLQNNQFLFIRDHPEKGGFDSRIKLLDFILKEVRKRKQLMKKKNVNDFTKYVALNVWNDIKLDYRFLLIDDVWDIVVSKHKKLALNFMLIVLYGPLVGIHVVFASVLSLRNILQQLVDIHPRLTIELQNRYGLPERKYLSDIGHEIFLTADNLVYYKRPGYMDLEKYYK